MRVVIRLLISRRRDFPIKRVTITVLSWDQETKHIQLSFVEGLQGYRKFFWNTYKTLANISDTNKIQGWKFWQLCSSRGNLAQLLESDRIMNGNTTRAQ